MYAFYYWWRSSGEGHGASFVFYILAATVYSTYACAWVRTVFAVAFGTNLNITQDCLTDWSVLRLHAKYPLLRDEILSPGHLPVSAYLKELA